MNEPHLQIGEGVIGTGSGYGVYDPELGLRIVVGRYTVDVIQFWWSPEPPPKAQESRLLYVSVLGPEECLLRQKYREYTVDKTISAAELRKYVDELVVRHMVADVLKQMLDFCYQCGVQQGQVELRTQICKLLGL